MVLLGQEGNEIQSLLNICGIWATEMGMEFNQKKSAVLVFSGIRLNNGWEIQGKKIEEGERYRYLGVNISVGKDMFSEERQILRAKAEKGRAVVKSRAMWTFDRYTITRQIWKSIFVPAVTFGSAIVVHKNKFWESLETLQRDVIRFSLGCRFNCAREFLEGEGGMSSFIEREVRSKLLYWRRLKNLEEDRWAKRVQEVKEAMRIRTGWDRRVEIAGRRLGYKKRDWVELDITDRQIKCQVTAMFTNVWLESLGKKSSLQEYKKWRKVRGGVQGIYSNGMGSGLMADARAGMLDTLELRSKFGEASVQCRVCRAGRENIDHIVRGCEALGGRREISLEKALGFESGEMSELEITKARLSNWRKRTWVVEGSREGNLNEGVG